MDVFNKIFLIQPKLKGVGVLPRILRMRGSQQFFKDRAKIISQMIVLESLYTYSARFFGK